MPDAAWSAPQLAALRTTHELQIAAPRADGGMRATVPIWAVVVGAEVLVRTWHARDTGWYGAARRTGRASVTVQGEDVAVVVDVEPAAPPAAVDRAYRDKYGRGADSMVTPAAVASTLRLRPAR